MYYDEPLEPTSPFYDLDNVLMSFHNCDCTDHSVSDSLEFFGQLLKEYTEGKELRNVVDIQEGY